MSFDVIRRDACGDCGEGCAVNHADPCAACYRRVWHARPNCKQQPSIVEMAGNATTATARWLRAGAPRVGWSVYKARLEKCRACPKKYWDEGARLGLGKCSAPGCGCTKLKLKFATEQCPIGEWTTEQP